TCLCGCIHIEVQICICIYVKTIRRGKRECETAVMRPERGLEDLLHACPRGVRSGVNIIHSPGRCLNQPIDEKLMGNGYFGGKGYSFHNAAFHIGSQERVQAHEVWYVAHLLQGPGRQEIFQSVGVSGGNVSYLAHDRYPRASTHCAVASVAVIYECGKGKKAFAGEVQLFQV